MKSWKRIIKELPEEIFLIDFNYDIIHSNYKDE